MLKSLGSFIGGAAGAGLIGCMISAPIIYDCDRATDSNISLNCSPNDEVERALLETQVINDCVGWKKAAIQDVRYALSDLVTTYKIDNRTGHVRCIDGGTATLRCINEVVTEFNQTNHNGCTATLQDQR